MTATSIPSMDLPETMSSSLPLKKRPVRTTDFANVEELATPKRMRIDGHHNIIMNNHHLSTRYPYSVASFGSASPRHESSAPLPAHVNSASGSGYTRDILFRHLQPLIHATAFDYSQLALSKSHSSAVSSLIGRGAGSHSSYLDALHYINSQRSMYPMTRPPMSSSTSSSTSTAPSPYSFLPPSPPESHKSEESFSSSSTTTAASPGVDSLSSGIACKECGKQFVSRTRFRAHLRRHSSKTSGRYQCHECQKSFVQRSSLTTHMRIHTGEKPFKCDQCPDSFGDYSTFTKHQRTHTGEKPYSCPVCQRTFSQSGNMHRHLKAVHQ